MRNLCLYIIASSSICDNIVCQISKPRQYYYAIMPRTEVCADFRLHYFMFNNSIMFYGEAYVNEFYPQMQTQIMGKEGVLSILRFAYGKRNFHI